MQTPRPLTALVATALAAGLVLTGTTAAVAAPKAPRAGKAVSTAPSTATAGPATAPSARKTAARTTRASTATATKPDRRTAQLRRVVLAELVRTDAALVRATQETRRTKALTPAHRDGLTAAASALRAELGAAHHKARAATTASELVALRRVVAPTVVPLLGNVHRTVAAGDAAAASSVAAEAALVTAVEAAQAAGKDLGALQAKVDAARAAAASTRDALLVVSDVLVADPRAAQPVTLARARGLTGAVKARTGPLRGLARAVAALPAPTEPTPTEPSPTEPAPTEPAPTEPAPTEPAPTQPARTEPAPAP